MLDEHVRPSPSTHPSMCISTHIPMIWTVLTDMDNDMCKHILGANVISNESRKGFNLPNILKGQW